jgi:lipoprotein NlpI
MYLLRLVRAALLLAGVLGSQGASAQQSTDNGLKEVQLGKTAFTLADPPPAWVDQLPIPEATTRLPIAIRLADTQYFLGEVPAAYIRRATLVNDAAALTAAGRFSIPFAPEYEHIQLHAIRIHRGQEQFDRTSTSNIRFLQREQDLERGVYSGRVTASILIDDVRVGDTVEIAYTSSGQNPVFGGKAFGASPWDQGLPTLHRRVVLNYPVGRPIAWRVVGDRPAPPLIPTDTIRDGARRITFDQQPLPGLATEAMTAPEFFGSRFVQFSEFANWSDVAGWANNLFEAAVPRAGEFQDIVKRIGALPSAQARVMAALEFAQSQIRYFSVSLGESSHRPTPPDEVLRRRYGDCKDKSLLLVTLLRELGIETRLVLLQMGRHAGLDKTLPSPQFFDHVIVQAIVDGKPYFLDPTRLGQHGQLDRIGPAHEGIQVLVVARDTNSVSLISAETNDVAGDEVTERATLARFGEEGQLEVRRLWRGLGAEQQRIRFERVTREQVTKFIGDAMERRYPGATLAREPAVHDDIARNEFSIVAHYKIPKLATEVEGNWVVAFSPDNLLNMVISAPSANRVTPLRIPGFPFHGKYSFEIIFPEQVSASIDPRAQTVTNKYFNTTVTEYFRGNVARKTIDLKTLQASVEAADYPGYAEDLRSANKAIGGTFFVNKALLNSTADAAKQDLTQRLKEQRLEVIKKTTETIGSGKLTGTDLANAYCIRGIAQADIDRNEEALQDTNNAVRLAPNVVVLLSCRADVYFRTGQFEKSVSDYSNAIALGAASIGVVFRARGVSKVYAGRIQEANEDFAKASDLSDKETRLYSDIWLVATCGRLGKPIPEDIVKRAAAEAHGDWPRAGLAMLIGTISPDDMLKSLEKKEGDERQMALAEAYFYLGQHYLITGDAKKARAFFEKTRDLGVISYIEHTSAEFELERLKKEGTTTSAKLPPAQRSVAH